MKALSKILGKKLSCIFTVQLFYAMHNFAFKQRNNCCVYKPQSERPFCWNTKDAYSFASVPVNVFWRAAIKHQGSNKGGSDSAWYNLKQKKINFISEFLNLMLKFILPSYVKFDYFYILCVFSTLRAPASYIHWSGFFQHVYEFWCDWCWSWQFIYLSCVFLNTFFTWWN